MSPSTTRDEPVAFEEIAAAPTTVESPQREDIEEIVEKMRDGAAGITPEMRAKVEAYYGRKAEEENLAPSADVVYILDKIALMSEEQAMEILVKAIDFHSIDPNFPGATMAKIKMLVQGQKASGLDPADYDFDLKTEAAIIHYVSYRDIDMPRFNKKKAGVHILTLQIALAVPRGPLSHHARRRPKHTLRNL